MSMSGNEANNGSRAVAPKLSGDFPKKVELPEDVAEIATVATEADIQEAAKSVESLGVESDTELEAAIEYLSCLPMKFKVVMFKKMLKSKVALLTGVAEFKADRKKDLDKLSADLKAEQAKGKAKLTKLGVLESVYGEMIMENHAAGVAAALIAEAVTLYEAENGDKFSNKSGVLVTYTYNTAAIKTFISEENKRRAVEAKAAKKRG
jgi:hypothetical protein